MSSQTTTDTNGTASFDDKLPLLWAREEVKDWVLRYIRLYGQQHLKVTNFDMTGVLLCNLTLEELCQKAGKQVGEKMFEDLAERNKVHRPNVKQHRARQVAEDEGINKIIKIHTDRHRSILAEIDDAIRTVLETGELPLFENEMTLERVFVSMLNLLPHTKQSEYDYCIIREVVKQPLFIQKELPAMLAVQAPNIPEEYILSHGLLRLLVEVDAVIHSFLQSHLCKNARQVEALIRNTIAIRSWMPTSKTPVTTPPVLVLPSMVKPTAAPVTNHLASTVDVAAPDLKPSNSAISCTSTLPSIDEDKDTDDSDESFDNERSYNHNNRLSHISPFTSDSGHVSDSRSSVLSGKQSKQSSTHSIPPCGYGAPHTPRSPGPSTSSQGSEISTEDFEEMNPLIYGMGIDAPRVWSTRLTQLDDYFASSYGNHYYVDLKYDPSFHIEFLIGPNPKALNNSMAVLRGKHPYVTFSITNNTTTFVGFAVRCFNFNSPHNPRVIYPIMGLEVLEPSSVPWVRNADLPQATDKQDNYLVVEMLVCRTEVTAVWNVQRRYVIQLTDKSEMSSSTLKNIGSDVSSLGLNLKQVMMSGLFYMAQDRLSDAEVLFSHALHLPDFQRPEMKAYSLICLAMVLNKKRKNRRSNLVQVIGFTTAAKQLISAAKNITKIRMPTLIELVERLYEDLNLPQLIKHAKRRNMSTPIIDVTEEETTQQSITEETGEEDQVTTQIDKDGGSLIYDDTLSINIPPMAFTKSTKVTLKPTDKDKQLHQRASEMMLSPLLAIEISTFPKTSFNKQITINSILKSCPSTMGSQVRVLHGDAHLQNLNDITDECEVNLDPTMSKLTISTKNEGNIFAAAVCSDPVILYKRLLRVTQTRSPFCLQVSAYSSVFPNDQAVEVTVIGVPHVVGRRDSHAALPNTSGLKLISRRKMTVEVYSDDSLKYELKGNFVPHDRFGETNLTAEFEPSMTTSFLASKWVRLITLESSQNHAPHSFVVSGKLIISRKRDTVWQEIQSLNLFG